MPTIRTTSFAALWSMFTLAPELGDDDASPFEEGPRLVSISKHPEILPQRNSKFSFRLLTQRQPARPESDNASQRTARWRPARRKLKAWMSNLKNPQIGHTATPPVESCGPNKCCTLCQEEISDDLKYASNAKIIQNDDTYISTRCCHHYVHSSCYRITLQYFIDSKGRPRCAICRDYPDLFVACWALGYVFDKDVGDADDDECYCPPGIVCEVCEGRKQLLEDLQMSNVNCVGENDDQAEKLWTIKEDEEEFDR